MTAGRDLPDPMPVRVLVKGASTAVVTSGRQGSRRDVAYPRVVEAELRAAGLPADVRVTAAVGQRAKDSLATWEREVVPWSPDVVVLHYGQYEAVHLLIPARVERWVNRSGRRPGPVRDRIHRRLVRPAYRGMVAIQQRVDAAVPAWTWSRRAERIALDLERLVERVRTIASPLVLVVDQLPPDPAWAVPFPGMAARVELLDRALRNLVDRIGDPDVRLVSMRDIVDPLALDGPVAPDGGHFSPLVHQAVGHALANLILQWSASQPHLAVPREVRHA